MNHLHPSLRLHSHSHLHPHPHLQSRPRAHLHVPQPAPDVVPPPIPPFPGLPGGDPYNPPPGVPPELPPDAIPPEIEEPALPGEHSPVGDPAAPGDDPKKWARGLAVAAPSRPGLARGFSAGWPVAAAPAQRCRR